jgi:hypothetical protein
MMLRTMRLSCSDFWVDVRLGHVDGRYCVSGHSRRSESRPRLVPLDALADALTPFDGAVAELLESAPDVLYWP